MNEKDFNEIISTIENDANLEDADEYRRVATIRINIHIARQLTRIADNLDKIANPADEVSGDISGTTFGHFKGGK